MPQHRGRNPGESNRLQHRTEYFQRLPADDQSADVQRRPRCR
jgi:hypothetical protein